MRPMTDRDRRAVAGWLLVCAALVFAIVLVGGITRLTRSGLSIVEWQPLVGAAHQGGAVLLLAAALWTAHSARARPPFRALHAGA